MPDIKLKHKVGNYAYVIALALNKPTQIKNAISETRQ